MFEVPLVETPLNITVTRLTQLGMLVKSILVPLVEATAVPATKAPEFPWTPVFPSRVNGMICPYELKTAAQTTGKSAKALFVGVPVPIRNADADVVAACAVIELLEFPANGLCVPKVYA